MMHNIVISHESVQRQAYSIWEMQGRPEGKALDNWLTAERAQLNYFRYHQREGR